MIVILVGTKSDLCRSEFLDDGSEFARSRKVPFVITSSKDGTGIEDLQDILGPYHRPGQSCLRLPLLEAAQKIEHAGRTQTGHSIRVTMRDNMVRSSDALRVQGSEKAKPKGEGCTC